MLTNICTWEESADGSWESGCGHVFEFNTGSPSENGMRFCGYCGGHLREQRCGTEEWWTTRDEE